MNSDSFDSKAPPKRKKPMVRESHLTSASDLLQGLMENGKSRLGDQFQQWKVWRKWSEIVGESIASHSEPVNFNNGTLWVWVESSSWLQQLSYFAPQMRDNINRFVGANWIQQVRLTLDRQGIDKAASVMRDHLK